LAAFLFILPDSLGLLIFVGIPMGLALSLGFFSVDGFGGYKFVWFANYSRMLHDPLFLKSLWVTVVYVLVLVPGLYVTGLGLAVLVSQKIPFIAVWRSLFFMPYVVSLVVVGLTWKVMLIDKVGEYQLDEMVSSSYRPIEDYLPQILREEKGHISYGQQQLEQLMKSGDVGRAEAQAAVDKWYVVGLDMFGRSESARDERYIEWGLKKRTNGKMREDYIAEMDPKIAAIGLRVPDKLAGRKYL